MATDCASTNPRGSARGGEARAPRDVRANRRMTRIADDHEVSLRASERDVHALVRGERATGTAGTAAAAAEERMMISFSWPWNESTVLT